MYLRGGWVCVLFFMISSIDHKSSLADCSCSLRLVARRPAALLGVFFRPEWDPEQLCAGSAVPGCCVEGVLGRWMGGMGEGRRCERGS